jgi:hypothetical protein
MLGQFDTYGGFPRAGAAPYGQHLHILLRLRGLRLVSGVSGEDAPFVTRTISAFLARLALKRGVTAKQMISDSAMQSTPRTVRFFRKLIGWFLLKV